MNHFNVTIDNKGQLRMRKNDDRRHAADIKRENLPDIMPKTSFVLEDDPLCQRMYMREGFILLG